MRSKDELSLLYKDFPELSRKDVFWSKETYAHFGLLFSGYALLETSLQNLYIFWRMSDLYRKGLLETTGDWRVCFDAEERRAFGFTMGNLVRHLEECPDFLKIMPELQSLKRKRDYFAHHFFRNEAERLREDGTIVGMLCSMNMLRRRVSLAEKECDRVGFQVIRRVHPSYWDGLDLKAETELVRERLRKEAAERPEFPWERE